MQEVNTNNIALKILTGTLITLTEFKVALRKGFYTLPPEYDDNPDEYAELAYESLKASHYVSPKRIGYLCGKHKTVLIDEDTTCGYGLHVDEIDHEYLTEENKRYLGKLLED